MTARTPGAVRSDRPAMPQDRSSKAARTRAGSV